MSRTIKDLKITNKSLQEVKSFILDWLSNNGFQVNEIESKGRIIYVREPHSFLGSFIKPHRGAIVASMVTEVGCVVFELTLEDNGSDVNVHGEFYAAGELFFIGELDLKRDSGFLGKFPREGGYLFMIDFLDDMQGIHSILPREQKPTRHPKIAHNIPYLRILITMTVIIVIIVFIILFLIFLNVIH